MIDKLSPLHHHGGKLLGGDVPVAVDQSADGPGRWQRAAKDGLTETFYSVAVFGWKKSEKRPERRAPFGMFQVVTSSVARPIQSAKGRALNRISS